MEKIRALLRTIRRLHFWILSVAVLLISVTFWFLSVNKLDKETESRNSAIKTSFDSVTTVESIAPHPNQLIHDAMDQLISSTRGEIRDAWTEKWDQQQTDILTWPGEGEERLTKMSEENENAFKDEWNRLFISRVKPLRPIEKEVSFPLTKREKNLLRRDHREFYKSYIHKQLRAMAKVIGSKWRVSADAEGGFGMGGGAMFGGGTTFGDDLEPMGYGLGGMSTGPQLAYQTVVQWNQQNQTELQQQHFDWSRNAQIGMGARGNAAMGSSLDEVPDTLEILYAQEDLWVLRALMAIIGRTNAGAQSRHIAAIKRIEFIRIGKAAIPSFGQVEIAQSANDGADDGMGGGFGGGFGGGMGGGQTGTEAGAADGGRGMAGGGYGAASGGFGSFGGPLGEDGEMVLPDPAEGRYVDKNYEPLSAETLRSVMTAADEVDPENAYLAVAKRVPVRMRFSMDQTKIKRLLVECANAELTVEVRQVRINPKDMARMGGAFGAGMGAMAGGSAMMPGGAGFGGKGMGGFDDESMGGFGGKSMDEFDEESMDGYDDESMGGIGGRGMLGGRGGMGGSAVNRAMLYPFDLTVEIYGIVYIYSPVDRTILGYEEEGDVNEAASSEVAGLDVRANPN